MVEVGPGNGFIVRLGWWFCTKRGRRQMGGGRQRGKRKLRKKMNRFATKRVKKY